MSNLLPTLEGDFEARPIRYHPHIRPAVCNLIIRAKACHQAVPHASRAEAFRDQRAYVERFGYAGVTFQIVDIER